MRRAAFILLAVLACGAASAQTQQEMNATEGVSPSIEVFAFTRATYGRIRLSGLPDGATVLAEYLPSAKIRPARHTAVDAPGDLEQSRRITGRTILAVAHLLAEEK